MKTVWQSKTEKSDLAGQGQIKVMVKSKPLNMVISVVLSKYELNPSIIYENVWQSKTEKSDLASQGQIKVKSKSFNMSVRS